MNVRRTITIILLLAWGLAWPPSPPIQAAPPPYTVNTTDDTGDGICDATHCSLRDALNLANSNPGRTIKFDILGCGGVCTIQPTSALPTLSGGSTTIDGSTDLDDVIQIDGSSAGSTDGFYVTSANNLITGLVINRFSLSGIHLTGSGATGNIVSRNYVGTGASGTSELGNGLAGVEISDGAQNNTIGGDTAPERNVISGNGSGVDIYGSGTMSNTVSGNYIGTDYTGTADLGNGATGLRIYSGAKNNTVGGDTESERNVISGNGSNGVLILGDGATGNTISGNYIGTNATGTADLGNDGNGIRIYDGAQSNTVGGSNATPGGVCSGECNVISGNDDDGVQLEGSGTMSNIVSGNYIGTNASGTGDLGNTDDGVLIAAGAQNNTIGGDTEGERNVISGNDGDGIYIYLGSTTGNTISGNYIGTDASGTGDLGNAQYGVRIRDGAQNNTVGGSNATPGGACSGECNVISGNDDDGATIGGADTRGNTISGNYVGTDASGTAALGNSGDGVYLTLTDHNTVGGDTAGERNVISGNGGNGVYVRIGAVSNIVSGNYIGTNASGTGDLGNAQYGVRIRDGAQNNTVGGSNATPGGACSGECNVISGNDDDGATIGGADTRGNTISGNYIGTDASGTAALGNSGDGVYLTLTDHNTVGGDTAGERNVISGNGGDGVYVRIGAVSNIVSGNYIGIDASGTAALGNTHGVFLDEADDNIIGGDTAGERNVISGNRGSGVYICTPDTLRNTVSGNYIGTDATGASDLGNTGEGVEVCGGAQDNTIGGDTAGEGNLISGNDGDGVWLYGSGTTGNIVSGNTIGTGASGTSDLGNTWYGVLITAGAQNSIIGPGNVIAHNGQDGVEVNGSDTINNTITQNSIFSNDMGIDLMMGANGDIAAPVIADVLPGPVRVVGTACAGCTVEVFANSDTDGEGETFIGGTTADLGGAFTLTVASLTKAYLTATATDGTGNTSEFSAVFTARIHIVFLPLIMWDH